MSREHPIIICQQLIPPTLDGRKTQTRRVIKWPKDWQNFDCDHVIPLKSDMGYSFWAKDSSSFDMKCPYGQVGDLLWVREAWHIEYNGGGAIDIHYKAGGSIGLYNPKMDSDFIRLYDRQRNKWNSSRFMYKWAARIWLEITGIRAERVQDISKEDAKAEGVEPENAGFGNYGAYQCSFIELWDSINAKRGYSWNENPWVWAIEFKRINK